MLDFERPSLDDLGEDERMMIDAIRGKNLNDEDFASSNTVMDFSGSNFGGEGLPTRYDAQYLDG
jgi:hypothetical protein